MRASTFVTPDTPWPDCPRPDCPVRALDEAERARVDALPPAAIEAITRTWCRNPRVLDGSLCAASLAWYLANHDRLGRRDNSQDERVRQPKLSRTTRGSNKRSNTRPGGTVPGVVQDETQRL